MKKWAFVLLMIAVVIVMSFIFRKIGLWKTMSPEELEGSIEVVDVNTKWVEKFYQAWPPKLILVPAISFKVKNVTEKPLRYINFNAIFKFKDDYENLGDSFMAAIRNDPVLPGGLSDVILLKSNYGIEGKSVTSFKNNPQWKPVFVSLYAQSKGSQYIPLGEWDVSKKIDFEEPEPVGTEEEEEKPKKKN